MFKIETFMPGLKPFFGVLLFFVVLLIFYMIFHYLRYKNSGYGAVSGNSFWRTVLNKGNYGEFLTFRILEKLKGNNKLLTNVYIPKVDGSTTEIDLLLINRSGIYVFESKNYSGWIFGDEKNKNWTTSLKGGRKIQFLSPVIQNNGHIKALRTLLGETSHIFYSYIVFSERCKLKKVSVTTPDIFVVKRDMLLIDLRKDLSKRAAVLTDDQITALYETLLTHSLADTETKEKHIQSIVNRQKKVAPVSTHTLAISESVISEPTQSQDRISVDETEASEGNSNLEDTPIYQALKQYRYDKSKEEDVKAYFVFNNAQLLAIIAAMPASMEDLKKISGFGDVKCQKYGDKILEIVQMNCL